jgi:hypothetical protein
MAVSYRGKQVDMVSLAKKYEKNVALGNAHMNGRGDIIGHGGKIVKTREEQLAEYYEGNKAVTEEVNLKKESVKEVEKEVKKLQEETITKAKPRAKRPVYEDITDEEKAELDKLKVNND